MKIFNFSLVISVIITILLQILSYKELNNCKFKKISIRSFFVLLVIFILILINNCYNTSIFKAFIGFLAIIFINRIVFKDTYNVIINTTFISYLIVILTEIVLSIIFVNLGKFEIDYLSTSELLIFVFSVSTNIVCYFSCKYFKFIKHILKKINDRSFSSYYKVFLLIVFLLILVIIDFRNVYMPSNETFILGILLIVSIFIIAISYVSDEFKINAELKKADILLDNITKYEKIIDDNRINSHEMHNNLLLLKSIKNKNSKKFDKLLDEMILLYDKNGEGIKNISLLPQGIKGIIYYKIYDLDKKGIVVTVNISKQVSNKLEKIVYDEFIILSKCISILLDNAIDACIRSENKYLLIDIYKEKKNIIVSIENSFDDEIDFNLINLKNYSTKGQNRGYGLYIINKLLVNSRMISLDQDIKSDYFVSKLIVNNE